jgi:hypothetical protein
MTPSKHSYKAVPSHLVLRPPLLPPWSPCERPQLRRLPVLRPTSPTTQPLAPHGMTQIDAQMGPNHAPEITEGTPQRRTRQHCHLAIEQWLQQQQLNVCCYCCRRCCAKLMRMTRGVVCNWLCSRRAQHQYPSYFGGCCRVQAGWVPVQAGGLHMQRGSLRHPPQARCHLGGLQCNTTSGYKCCKEVPLPGM